MIVETWASHSVVDTSGNVVAVPNVAPLARGEFATQPRRVSDNTLVGNAPTINWADSNFGNQATWGFVQANLNALVLKGNYFTADAVANPSWTVICTVRLNLVASGQHLWAWGTDDFTNETFVRMGRTGTGWYVAAHDGTSGLNTSPNYVAPISTFFVVATSCASNGNITCRFNKVTRTSGIIAQSTCHPNTFTYGALWSGPYNDPTLGDQGGLRLGFSGQMGSLHAWNYDMSTTDMDYCADELTSYFS